MPFPSQSRQFPSRPPESRTDSRPQDALPPNPQVRSRFGPPSGPGSPSGRSAPLPARELVARCIADRANEAWDELVERFGSAVESGACRAIARFRMRPDPDRVEDYAQETWYRLLEDGCRRLRGFRGDTGTALRSWLRRAAERTAIDLLRAELAAKRGDDRLVAEELAELAHRIAPADSPEVSAELRDRLRWLGRRVLALNGDPRNAKLLRLVLVEGWTASELARASGGRIRPSRVDSLVHRIRRRLAAEGWDVDTAGTIAA